MQSSKTKAALLFLLTLTFGVLLLGGYLIHRDKPPIPATVVADDGHAVYSGEDVTAGQSYFMSRGGQHMGSVWGHGAYLAPDWSADYLHRLGLFVAARHLGLDPRQAAAFTQADLEKLDPGSRGKVTALVTADMKTNRFDVAADRLTVTNYMAEGHASLVGYYTDLFRNGNSRMGLQAGIVQSDEQGRQVGAFFGWLAWAAGCNRLGQDHTYTNNWPYDELVGNRAMPDALVWSIVSVILLILGVAAAIFIYQRYIRDEDEAPKPIATLAEPKPPASQKATLAYFITAMALFVIQVLMGSLTGHFTVEGTSFLGFPIAKILPYAAVRTWHLQLSVFFIATCFLAAGLFIGPFVGREPKHQGKLVWGLFVAVVLVVVGALTGTYLSVMGRFGGNGFFLGHQGYEYIELGRLWQLLLIAGMIFWLVLVVRAIRPALRGEKDSGGLTHLLLYSAITIPAFYMAGLGYGKGSHLSDAEYWRWWVVHLWVEGFFEVFATVFMAFLLARIGVVGAKFALRTVYFSIFLYLGAGVIGTFHHLYWSGAPTPIVALGGVFSALEVVPLTLVGFEAVQNLRSARAGGFPNPYRWPIYFFLAVSFWNMLGAGVFGFMINPPIVLYYIQGINTTPIHAHTALFGVYGFLAISLMLFSMRNIVRLSAWSDRLLKWSFWGLNGGLLAMTLVSLVPSGFYQFYFAVRDGMWFARSPEIASGEVVRTLAKVRILPDLVFAAGAVLMLVFVVRAVALTVRKPQEVVIHEPKASTGTSLTAPSRAG
jgi:nitric oxide reductase subunit B